MTGFSDAADQLADAIDDALRPIALAVSRLIVVSNHLHEPGLQYYFE